MNKKIIAQSKLFSGFSDPDIEYALSFFSARNARYEKGEMLSRPGEVLHSFGLVLSGNLHVCMDDFDGNSIIMAVVTPSHTFGESLCFLAKESPIYICAVSDAEILWLSTDKIKTSSSDPRDVAIRSRFISMLASKTLEMNDRVQILSKIKIRDRLITYFSQNVAKYGNHFTVPLSREAMAAYLGTNRSALSRELCKMRDEGIIDFDKSSFTVKGHI